MYIYFIYVPEPAGAYPRDNISIACPDGLRMHQPDLVTSRERQFYLCGHWCPTLMGSQFLYKCPAA